MATPGPSGTRRGWAFDRTNGRLVAVYNDTEIFDFDGNDMVVTPAQTFTGISTHSDEVRIANGKNLRIGTIGAFVTTEPTNAVVMFQGTAFAGAITTAGGIQSTATVLTKIIAAGTVSNIET